METTGTNVSELYSCDLCCDAGNVHHLINDGRCIDTYCNRCGKSTWHCEREATLTEEEFDIIMRERFANYDKGRKRITNYLNMPFPDKR